MLISCFNQTSFFIDVSCGWMWLMPNTRRGNSAPWWLCSTVVVQSAAAALFMDFHQSPSSILDRLSVCLSVRVVPLSGLLWRTIEEEPLEAGREGKQGILPKRLSRQATVIGRIFNKHEQGFIQNNCAFVKKKSICFLKRQFEFLNWTVYVYAICWPLWLYGAIYVDL